MNDIADVIGFFWALGGMLFWPAVVIGIVWLVFWIGGKEAEENERGNT